MSDMTSLPPPDELRALIDLDKRNEGLPQGAHDRLTERLGPLLAASLVPAALPPAAPPAGTTDVLAHGASAIGHAFRWPALALALGTGAAIGSAATATVLTSGAPPPPRVEIRYVD